MRTGDETATTSSAVNSHAHARQSMNMILTTCAACAAPLALDAPRCVRCKTRYCNATCQHDHWRLGHKQICKKIHCGGNAEQYNADKKCKEAIAVAVEACAEDTKDQTCYICTEALHWKTKEGLVHECACRGTAGFAHVSCLAEQAKILVAECEENNLDENAVDARWGRWHTCSLCEQCYQGVVSCALGWACWKSYVGRACVAPGAVVDLRSSAIQSLASGLGDAGRFDEALVVSQVHPSMAQGAPLGRKDRWQTILEAQCNLAGIHHRAGRYQDALALMREVYGGMTSLFGDRHMRTLMAASNVGRVLNQLRLYDEAKSLLCATVPTSRQALGNDHRLVLELSSIYASALANSDQDGDPSSKVLGDSVWTAAPNLENMVLAQTIYEDVVRRMRRVLGPSHPTTRHVERNLEIVRGNVARTRAARLG